jgi:hypothetical protein
MRLVKDQILSMWEQRRAEAKDGTAEQDRRVKEIQQKDGRLDDGFLFAQSIDRTSYERQREELTLAQIDHHADATDELDIQGILACAERIPQRASDLWVHGSLDYKQRLQALFFPEGVGYDCHRFNRTAVTAPLFNYLAPNEVAEERVGAGGGDRTHTPFRVRDFKSRASASFATPAWPHSTASPGHTPARIPGYARDENGNAPGGARHRLNWIRYSDVPPM